MDAVFSWCLDGGKPPAIEVDGVQGLEGSKAQRDSLTAISMSRDRFVLYTRSGYRAEKFLDSDRGRVFREKTLWCRS